MVKTSELMDTFIAVAAFCGTNKAADHLWMSPCSVRWRLRQLESRINTQLFERDEKGKRIYRALTVDGARLFIEEATV